MNIGHVGGNGGIDPGPERAARAKGKRDDAAGSAAADDNAAISEGGREAAATFEARVVAAEADEPDRFTLVARAMERLIAGDLDEEAVHRDVAQRLLSTDFQAV